MGEESSQPTKHGNKIIMSIFLIMKATNLDTQGRRFPIGQSSSQMLVKQNNPVQLVKLMPRDNPIKLI